MYLVTSLSTVKEGTWVSLWEEIFVNVSLNLSLFLIKGSFFLFLFAIVVFAFFWLIH